MKRQITILLIGLMIIFSKVQAQRLWGLYISTSMYFAVNGDTSVTNLKNLMIQEKSFDAARILAYYHGETERDFILNHLRAWAYEDTFPLTSTAYYEYQYVRGFLGDTGAIAGMDTLALHPRSMHKFPAVRELARAGRYNYFDYVKSVYYNEGRDEALEVLAYYGRDNRFRDEVMTIIRQYIESHPRLAAVGYGPDEMALIDRSYTIQFMDQLFRSTTGKVRYNYFLGLSRLDEDGQPERAMFVIPLESNDTIRSEYIPLLGRIKDGVESKRYLKPFFIKFVKDRVEVETSNWVKPDLEWFLSRFKPFPPIDNVPSLSLLDTLISTKHQVASYGWVGDNNFVTELDNHLNSAKNFLVSGDSLGCAKQIFNFQKKVNEEYKDSLDGDTRFINTEGWKFLYYNADYILERLPGIITITSYIDSSWNMISIPVDPPYFSKSEIYPNSVSSAYIFKPDTGYVATNQLENGIGFWLKFNKRDTVNYRGFVIEKETIDVKTGWNLIGTISMVLDTNKVQILPQGIMLSKFFGFSKNLGYFITNKLYPGRAYWIKVSQPGKLILDKYSLSGGGQGSEPLPPPPPGAPEVPELYLPVNGSSSISRTPTLHWYESNNAQSYRLQLSTNSNFTSIVYDDSTITTSSKTVGPLSNSTTHYWRVRAKNDIWTSDWSPIWYFRTQGSQPDPCEPIEALTAMDEIIITDANGNSQKLYMYNGGRRIALGLRDYEMPPEPVEGIFHARFHSNKFIENIPPGKGIIKIPIKIKSAKYPVEIFWNIKSESKTKYWLYKTKNQKIEISGNNKVKINNIENDTLNIDAQALLPGPCY